MSAASEWLDTLCAMRGPALDMLGSYYDSFLAFAASTWPDETHAERLRLALEHANELVSEAETARNWRETVRALYLQQRLLLDLSRHEGEC